MAALDRSHAVEQNQPSPQRGRTETTILPRRSGKLKAARWVVAGLAASAIVAVGAYGASPKTPSVGARPSSAADWGSRSTLPDPCSNPAALQGVNPEQSRTLCLTAGADTKKVPGGSGHPAIAVYGLGGNDRISATNGPADIHGGAGYDKAWVLDEKYDTWSKDTERVYDKSGRRIQSLRTVNASTQFVPPQVPPREVRPLDPSVRCEGSADGSFRIRFSTEPTLRAWNTIPGKVEFQNVAYAAGLDWWDASRNGWYRKTTNPWQWDETYDRDWGNFHGNFWRTYDTLVHSSVWIFTIPADEPGYYRVRVAYHWYAAEQSYQGQTVDVADYDWEQFVPTHYDLSNDKTSRYPKDKYCAFGVDPAAGP